MPSSVRIAWSNISGWGGRYLHHVLEVKTYADRLHLASLLERLEQGLLEGLTREEYDGRVRNIERLERLGPRGN